jgi:NAD(P)-dependent dehydrogenase (short-subunit alcohol dehydrogenase family)
VTNPHDVNYAISHIQSQWGNIDVVIHAAGVVEDSLISEKSADSFRRVLHTKARSALYLYRALQAHPPRLIAFFSSLVAHTGNAGQTDYCAANEVLSAIAKQWSEQNESVRVVTYLWSVWTETGLASQAVQRLLQKHELAGITTSAGIRYFHAELADPSGADSVLITSPRTLNILSEGIWS